MDAATLKQVITDGLKEEFGAFEVRADKPSSTPRSGIAKTSESSQANSGLNCHAPLMGNSCNERGIIEGACGYCRAWLSMQKHALCEVTPTVETALCTNCKPIKMRGISTGHIHLCPRHAAVDALYAALKDLGEYAAALEMMLNTTPEAEALVNARATLALVDSLPTVEGRNRERDRPPSEQFQVVDSL